MGRLAAAVGGELPPPLNFSPMRRASVRPAPCQHWLGTNLALSLARGGPTRGRRSDLCIAWSNPGDASLEIGGNNLLPRPADFYGHTSTVSGWGAEPSAKAIARCRRVAAEALRRHRSVVLILVDSHITSLI